MSREKLTKSASRVAVGTMISRILGYLRDMLVAHAFGAGMFADAFYAAYRIPNLLRRLLGEGSLSASFIPVLSEYLHTKSKEETQKLINVVLTGLTIILVVLTALGIIFAPQIVHLIAWGFTDDPEKLELTITLTRLMFPFMLFICLAALVLGILNTLNSFFIPAISSASLSVSEITYILALAPMFAPGDQIKGLAISVIVGGLGQFAVQWPKMASMGWKLGWKMDFKHPGLKQIMVLMVPAMLGLSVDQINAFVDTICASFLELGSITALYYSNRLMQLPLAIFGLALSSAALPAMSKSAAVKDLSAVKDTLNYSIRLVVFIMLPSAVGLMIVGLPVISLLFERGNFDRTASLMTNSALFYYSLGLPAYAVTKIFASAFYSLKDTKTPVKAAAVAVALHVILNIALMWPMRVGGLALATAVSSCVNFSILAVILRKRIGALGLRRIGVTFVKSLAASAAMGAFAWWSAFILFRDHLLLGVSTSIIGGLVVFFAVSAVLKIEERKPLLAIVLKKEPTIED
ncbi:MAG: murein biosynthesis integral membrane protein MurJ [Endomicrobiales bacterium]|nr:murein biosynthesis integral membrane protein MurJ [Endomicrobiales bacterium]